MILSEKKQIQIAENFLTNLSMCSASSPKTNKEKVHHAASTCDVQLLNQRYKFTYNSCEQY